MAESDLVDKAAYYRRGGGDLFGARFFDAAISSLRGIEQMPGAGSLRASELTGISGLRVSRIAGFPCGWFYLDHDDWVDVVRLLADAQDLPSLFGGLDPPHQAL